jgi:hypothetical protein
MDYSYESAGYRFPKGCTALHVICLIPRWNILGSSVDKPEKQKRIIELLVNAGIDTTLKANGMTAEKYLDNPELVEHLNKCIAVKKNILNLAPPFYNNNGKLLSPGGKDYLSFKNHVEARITTPGLFNINTASRRKAAWASAAGVNSEAVESIIKGSPPSQESINSEVGIIMKKYEGLLSSYAGELHRRNGGNAVEAKRKNTRKLIEAAIRKGLNSNTRATMLRDIENLWNPPPGGGARRRKTRKTRKNRKSNKLGK